MKPSVLISTAVLAFVAVPAVASAQDQPWLKDRRYTEGIGYQVGDFELHPGAAVELGYDSNYTHACSVGGDCPTGVIPPSEPVGTMRLRITPSFSIESLGAQRRETAGGPPPSVAFHGRVSLTGDLFFGVSGDTKSAGSNLDNVGIASDVGVQILPGHTWSGNLNASYSRALTPTDSLPAGAFSSANTFDRDLPSVGGELVFTPGAGLFDYRLGYEFSGAFFEDGTHYQGLDNVNNQIQLRSRWKFLPRTALVFDGRFNFINYTSTSSTLGTLPPHPAAHPVRTELGVNGLITPTFSILAMGGWGSSFYAESIDTLYHNFDSFIGQLELKWYVTPNPTLEPGAATLSLSSIAVGFLRDFSDSYLGTYFERDRGYVNLSYNYAGRFLVVVEGGGAAIPYPAIPNMAGSPTNPQTYITHQAASSAGFTDVHIDASIFGEWRFKDSFGINTTLRYNQEISTVTLFTPMPASIAYKDFEAYLGFRWLM
jgi:hypothetical protein